MERNDIYELLALYGDESAPEMERKRIRWKDVPPEKVLHILEAYDDLSQTTEILYHSAKIN